MANFVEIRSFKIPSAFWKPKPKKDTPDLIMTLPTELRNIIYEMSLADWFDHKDAKGVTRRGCRSVATLSQATPGPGLLRTSRQVRAEASPIFYGTQDFISVSSLNPKAKISFKVAMLQCESIIALCGLSPFKAFRVEIIGPIYEWLDQVIHLLELMRSTGFEPVPGFILGDGVRSAEKARSIESGAGLFPKGLRSERAVLGRAITLGRRARDEKWSKERLAGRFGELVSFARRNKNGKRWPSGL